jgi:hypothetical protein
MSEIAAPPLAPDIEDLLKPTERDILRAIVQEGDLIEAQGEAWLLVPLSPGLIDMLAAFEADLADLEDDTPCEPAHDDEPSLGATEIMNQERSWKTPGYAGLDLEYDGDTVASADAEPLLGAPERHPSIIGWSASDQARWGGGSGAMEEEQVNEDGDGGFNDSVDHEPSLGAINPDPHTGDGMDQIRWASGNADDREAVRAGATPRSASRARSMQRPADCLNA